MSDIVFSLNLKIVMNCGNPFALGWVISCGVT